MYIHAYVHVMSKACARAKIVTQSLCVTLCTLEQREQYVVGVANSNIYIYMHIHTRIYIYTYIHITSIPHSRAKGATQSQRCQIQHNAAQRP